MTCVQEGTQTFTLIFKFNDNGLVKLILTIYLKFIRENFCFTAFIMIKITHLYDIFNQLFYFLKLVYVSDSILNFLKVLKIL